MNLSGHRGKELAEGLAHVRIRYSVSILDRKGGVAQ